MIKRIKPKSLHKRLELEDRFIFGKYKGRTIEYVIYEDSSYINWCLENDIFRLSNEALKLANKYDPEKRKASYDRDRDQLAEFGYDDFSYGGY